MEIVEELFALNNQIYENIHDIHRGQKNLFTDPTFPPESKSISPTGKFDQYKDAVWKRPGEICDNPKLFVDGSSTRDVCQGHLGDCWLVSSMATLALHPKCLAKVIPDIERQQAQLCMKSHYSGAFRFRFWRYGRWCQVVIDDYLPTDSSGALLFAHSKSKNEFWSALLEKAYAKMSGSYEALIGGQEEEALCDFTGGMPEQIFEINKYAQTDVEMIALFTLLSADWISGAMICSSIASNGSKIEERLPNGLCTTHAYSVTGMLRMHIRGTSLQKMYPKDESILLIRIRNPWGEYEWNGAFSDSSEESKLLNSSEKKKLDFRIENDGECWMPFKEWLLNFNQITLVRLVSDQKQLYNQRWFGGYFKGHWSSDSVVVKRETALECTHDNRTQYYFHVNKKNGDVLLLHLLQMCKRLEEIGMGILIFQVESNRLTNLCNLKWGNVILEFRIGGSRSICLRYQLNEGSYVIVPFISVAPTAGKHLNYFLRLFTTTQNDACTLVTHPPVTEAGCLCKKLVTKLMTRVKIIRIDLNTSYLANSDSELYCEMTCENVTLTTRICSDPRKLEWNETFLFYRFLPEKYPVCIKVIEKGMLMNSVIGASIIPAEPCDICTEKCLPAFETNLKNWSKKVKGICVEWYNTHDVKNL